MARFFAAARGLHCSLRELWSRVRAMHIGNCGAPSVRASLRRNKKPPGRAAFRQTFWKTAASTVRPLSWTPRPRRPSTGPSRTPSGSGLPGGRSKERRRTPPWRRSRFRAPARRLSRLDARERQSAQAVVDVPQRGAEAGVGDVRPWLALGNRLDPVEDVVGCDHSGRGGAAIVAAARAKMEHADQATRGSGAAGAASAAAGARATAPTIA